MFDLISQMLQSDPKSRPTASDCLQHRWFSQVNKANIKPLPKF